MLLRFINAGGLVSHIVIILLAIITWSHLFVDAYFMQPPTSIDFFYNIFFKGVGNFRILAAFLCLLIIISTAYTINFALASNDLIPRNSVSGAFIFVIISAISGDLLVLSPGIFASIFIAYLLFVVLKLYDSFDSLAHAFNAGFIVALASFFYFPAFMLIGFVWAVFVIYRLFYWRSWLSSILGLAVPYLFLTVWYFWNDKLALKFLQYHDSLMFSDLPFSELDVAGWIVIVAFAYLSLSAILKFLRISGEKPIKTRKFLGVVLWLFFVSICVVVVSSKYLNFGATAIFVPLSALITVYINILRNKTIKDWVIIVLLLLIIAERTGFAGIV